jgi:hypothetical protein
MHSSHTPNPFAPVVDYRFPKTAGNSERTAKDLAVFHPPSRQKSKVSAANAMPLADNLLPEQRKTAKLE